MDTVPEFHNVLAWGEDKARLTSIQHKFLKYFPEGGRILDIGSGRGFFLELLTENGYIPEGVDMDPTMQKVSAEQGFTVHTSDALTFLKSTNKQYDGIFASHIIEHMPIDDGIEFISLIKQHLAPGGVAIIITPRPGSLWATENFWLDTTHVRPYPYELMKKYFTDFELLVGGIEPDSNPVIHPSKKKRLALAFRRVLFGAELFDFVYGGGVSYIVAKKPLPKK